MSNSGDGGEKLAYKSLSHKEKKDSTAKWFVIIIIPFLIFYWFWKAAEVISGHRKHALKYVIYEALEHMDKKESTGKWFGIFLIPMILEFLDRLNAFGGGIAAVVALGIAFIMLIYVVYKMAVIVSGHEIWYSEKYKAVMHKEKMDSTVKWFVIGMIPIVCLHLMWKMSETISGHETVYK